MTITVWVIAVLILLLGVMALLDVFRYFANRDDSIDTDDFGDR